MMLTSSNACTNGVLAFLPMNQKAFEGGRKCEGMKDRTERVVGKASGLMERADGRLGVRLSFKKLF